jgi:hypothetical protein
LPKKAEGPAVHKDVSELAHQMQKKPDTSKHVN